MGSSRSGALRVHHLLAVSRGSAGTLRRLVVWVLFAVAAGGAMATVPVATTYSWADPGIGASGPKSGSGFSTPEAACRDAIAVMNPYRSSPAVYASSTVSSCRMDRPAGTFYQSTPLTAVVACPANSTAAGSSCTCNTGYVEDSTHTSCQLPPDPCAALAGTDAGDWLKDKAANAAGTGPASRSWSVCNAYSSTAGGKCVITVSNATCTEAGFGSDVKPGDGFWRCVGKGVYTGSSAIGGKCDAASSGKGTGDSPADPSPATPPVVGTDPPKAPSPKPADGLPAPAPCPAGQAPGTVNGASNCYPTGSDSPKAGGSDSTTNNADGSKVTQHNETTCDAGGNKCKTDTKTCTTPSGSSTETCSNSSVTQSAAGTCTKDPGNSVCSGGGGGPGGGFSGTCAAGFQAKGEDPILNAMAMEQYKRNCQVLEKDADPASTVNRIRNGVDTLNTDKAKADAAAAPVTVDTFDANGRGWGRACPADPTIQLNFVARSFTIPFSRVCAPLNAFAIAAVALTMLGSFVWVMGGKK